MSDADDSAFATDAPRLPAHARATGTDSGRNATALAIVWTRLEKAEELIATMGAGLAVTQALMDLGLTRRQARAYQAAVAKRWRLESRGEAREQRLERYRRTLEQVVKQGFERKVTVLVDAKSGEYETVPQPDLKAVTAATALLIRMDGGDAPAAPALPSGEARPAGEAVVLSAGDAEAEMMRRRDEGER